MEPVLSVMAFQISDVGVENSNLVRLQPEPTPFSELCSPLPFLRGVLVAASDAQGPARITAARQKQIMRGRRAIS